MRRALRAALHLALVALLVIAPLPARGQSRPDRRLKAVVERAETLLAQLELEAARRLLEEAARNRAHQRASGALKGRLFVTLGRARAELGDLEGAEGAFRVAVRWSPRVTLPELASPKIRDLLERVRAVVLAELASEDRSRGRRRRRRGGRAPSRSARRTAEPKKTRERARAEADAARPEAERREARAEAGAARPGAERREARAEAGAERREARAETGASGPEAERRETRAEAGASGPEAERRETRAEAGASGPEARAEAGAARPKAEARAAPGGSSGRRAQAKKAPPSARSARPESEARTASSRSGSRSEEAGPSRAGDAAASPRRRGGPPKRAPEPAGPRLRARVEPQGEEVRFVLAPEGLPEGAELFAFVGPRDEGASAARRLRPTRTGTIARLVVPVADAGLLAWFEARVEGRTVARAGSIEDPIRTPPPAAPPSLADAWSSAPPGAGMPGLNADAPRPTSTSTRAADLPMTTWGPGLGDTEIWALAISAVVVTAGVITLVALLEDGQDCGAPEGFGCTRVQVQPLVRF